MSNCNCEPKTYNIGMGCCQPVLAPIENYYTKWQIDKMIESATTSGCCITPEEVDDKITSAKTDIESEIPSLSGYATEQWVEDKHYITGVDLSDYATTAYVNTQISSQTGDFITGEQLSSYTYSKAVIDSKIASGGTFDPSLYYNKTETDNLLDNKLDVSAYTPTDLSDYYTKSETNNQISSATADMATKTWVGQQGYLTEHQSLSGYATQQWVINQNYALNAEVIQYITNLQQQIDSLTQTISGCCGGTGETQYRWITMTGANDYWCDETTKKVMEKQQSSTDGLNWTDTGVVRSGSTVLAYESVDCGYDVTSGLKITLNDNTVISYNCEDMPIITCGGSTYRKLSHDFVMSALTSPSDAKKINIGTCVDVIGYDAFSGLTNLQKVVIPSTFKCDYETGCDGIDVNAFEGTAIRTVGLQGSGADVEWNDNMEDMASQMFKGCTALTTVELPSTFKAFQPKAFSGCTNLQSITIHSTALPILNDWVSAHSEYDGLDGIGNNTFVIYVPSNMVDTYKNAVDPTGQKNWSKYADRIQAIQ